MENLKMVSFSTDEIHAEILEALDQFTPVFKSGLDCMDKIYEGEIFENIHPDNDPKADFSKEAVEALEMLMELTDDADFIMIWLA
jgi:hypothetical protein